VRWGRSARPSSPAPRRRMVVDGFGVKEVIVLGTIVVLGCGLTRMM
jgi:hypothetical protein